MVNWVSEEGLAEGWGDSPFPGPSFPGQWKIHSRVHFTPRPGFGIHPMEALLKARLWLAGVLHPRMQHVGQARYPGELETSPGRSAEHYILSVPQLC